MLGVVANHAVTRWGVAGGAAAYGGADVEVSDSGGSGRSTWKSIQCSSGGTR